MAIYTTLKPNTDESKTHVHEYDSALSAWVCVTEGRINSDYCEEN